MKKHLFLFAALLLVLVTVLWPGSGAAEPFRSCLTCGEAWLARLVLQALVFLPAGVALAISFGSAPAGVAVGALEAAVALAEGFVPGGAPGLAALAGALAGGGAGVVLAAARRHLLVPPPRVAAGLAVGSAVMLAGLMFFTGWAMHPEPATPPYMVEWQPTGGDYAEYDGRVMNAGVGTLRVRPGPTAEAVVAVDLLRSGAPLGAWTLVGPPPAGFAPLIAIFDADGWEAAVLGVDGTSLAFRSRTRAYSLGLVNPLIRVRGAMDSLAVGDSARLATGRAPAPVRRCFDVATRRYCGVGYTGAGGWALLFDVRGGGPGTEAYLDTAWLALLAVPLGFWARARLAALLFMVLAWYGVFRLPADTVARPVPVMALLGLLVGIGVGMLLARRLAGRRGWGAGTTVVAVG
jgi:hypothetical protein